VIGLQALAKLAEKLSKDTNSVRVTFEHGENGDETYMSINSATSMILQKHIVRWNELLDAHIMFSCRCGNRVILILLCLCFYQLSAKTRYVNITASGKGFALVQVSYQYNVNVTGAWPLFTLDPQVDKNSNINHLQLSICSGYVCVIILLSI